jgi:hypothetical protein
MKVLASKITVTNCSHELRVRLRPQSKLIWDTLKQQAEKAIKQPMSDTAFFNQLLADLANDFPPTFISVSEVLSFPVAKSKPKSILFSEYGVPSVAPQVIPTIDNINNLTV